MEIMLVLPISAAQCERAVSAQNRIKSSLRVGLDSSTLQDLIRITAEGPPVLNFDATSAVDKWLNCKGPGCRGKTAATALSQTLIFHFRCLKH